MKCRRIRTMLTAMAGVLLLATSMGAQALLIDFTAKTWQDNEVGDSTSAKTRTIGGIDVTISAYRDLLLSVPGTLTFTDFDGSTMDAPCGALLACDSDGGGIGDDEITFGSMEASTEVMVVSFGSAVDISQIHLLDLFAAPDGSGGGNEVAEYLVNFEFGLHSTLTGTAMDRTGYAVADNLVFEDALLVAFFSTNFIDPTIPDNSDFALAAIEVNVPEPETIALLALGLLGLGGLAQRRQAVSRI